MAEEIKKEKPRTGAVKTTQTCREAGLLIKQFNANAAKALNKKSLYIGDVQIAVTGVDLTSASQDFCAKLFRWKGQDIFCPTQIRSWSYAYAPMRARSWFPEEMEAYRADNKKLFILTHELSLTGAPIVLSHAVRILKEEGWQILIVAPENGVLKQQFLDMRVPVLVLEGDYTLVKEQLKTRIQAFLEMLDQ